MEQIEVLYIGNRFMITNMANMPNPIQKQFRMCYLGTISEMATTNHSNKGQQADHCHILIIASCI